MWLPFGRVLKWYIYRLYTLKKRPWSLWVRQSKRPWSWSLWLFERRCSVIVYSEITGNDCCVVSLVLRLCEPCMLDPGCGFCYRENGSALLTSSCVPVNMASTEQAAWGRWVTKTAGGKHVFFDVGPGSVFLMPEVQNKLSVLLSFRCSNTSRMKEHAYWAYNYCPTSYSWVVLLGLVLYLAAFAPGKRH